MVFCAGTDIKPAMSEGQAAHMAAGLPCWAVAPSGPAAAIRRFMVSAKSSSAASALT